jgi:hypothetical protein
VVTVAIKDIRQGEEILDNYMSFADTSDDNLLFELERKFSISGRELDPALQAK